MRRIPAVVVAIAALSAGFAWLLGIDFMSPRGDPSGGPPIGMGDLDVVHGAPGSEFRRGTNATRLPPEARGLSTPAVFWLRAPEIQVESTRARIQVSFHHAGSFLARVTRKLEIARAPGHEPGDERAGTGSSDSAAGRASVAPRSGHDRVTG